MKKLTYVIIVAAIFAVARFAFAEEMEGMMEDGMMGKGKMMEKGMMMGKGMSMGQGMMGRATMVSSNDGGVILLIGNKLYKYDKDLNLVKEVEIKKDETMCPMCQKMMEQKGAADKTPQAVKTQPQAEKEDHEIHH